VSAFLWEVPATLVNVYHDRAWRPVGCVELFDESERPVERLHLDTGRSLRELPTDTLAVYRDGEQYVRVSHGPELTIRRSPVPD